MHRYDVLSIVDGQQQVSGGRLTKPEQEVKDNQRASRRLFMLRLADTEEDYSIKASMNQL